MYLLFSVCRAVFFIGPVYSLHLQMVLPWYCGGGGCRVGSSRRERWWCWLCVMWCVGCNNTRTEPGQEETELLQMWRGDHRPHLPTHTRHQHEARPYNKSKSVIIIITRLYYYFLFRGLRWGEVRWGEVRWGCLHKFSIREHRTWPPDHLEFSSHHLLPPCQGNYLTRWVSDGWPPSM